MAEPGGVHERRRFTPCNTVRETFARSRVDEAEAF